MEMSFKISLMFLLMTADVDGQQVWVNYSPSYVCALRDSTVRLNCTLTQSDRFWVTATWTKSAYTHNLCSDTNYTGKVQCVYSEYNDTHSIILTNVTEADKHIYYCRFTTNCGYNCEYNVWIPGVQLDVTDLQVETNQRVKEGDSVTLTCKTTCSLTEETTFIWYRYIDKFTKGRITLNQLHLQSVSRDDFGVYRCAAAVRGSESLLFSPGIHLTVYHLDQPDWGVNYSASYVCALRGSTVRINCTLKYPSGHVVNEAFWTKAIELHTAEPNLCVDPKYKRGVCQRENQDIHSITLTNVTETDKRIYYCRFITNQTSGKWRGVPGVQLDVTDLQVETNQRVKEGDSVTLTCKTTCSLTEETTFIWYRNTERFTKGIKTLNQLHLLSVSRDDSGVYRCAAAVRGTERLLSSPDVYLSVEYPPEKTSVSISGSGEIMEGDSMNLTCSSESNPPVQIYSWFKENETSSVGSGQTYRISNFNSSHSGWFYCEAQNEVGSQRSAAVSVTVTGVHGFALYTLYGILAGCGALFFIIIIFIILFIIKHRRGHTAEDIKQKQTADSSDDTYTALNPESRTSDDIYNTIRSDQCSAADGVYTTLKLQSRSSKYDSHCKK
ncbi:B-cell receptor CD22-like isoform X2 [Paramisgurnus dabryanus]|uniref:B-cell receptor CD22-like isoform X2 n=1 Tax=Paramisgurnus dabryanus TaxID=90735 RepID=UPI003CCF13FE